MKRVLASILSLVMLFSTVGVVAADENICKIGDFGYPTLSAAVEAAGSGAKIELLKDASGEGVKVASGKNFTLDLGGYTYTVVAPTVGSEGTKTSGFQLLKDSTITITNGNITSEEAKFLIQNYANLTLDGVTLDGSKLAESTSSPNYTLSNNCGDIVIKDSTIIADTDGDYSDFAFDVCDYASYGGVKVTVKGNSEIYGKIEITDPNGGDKAPELVVEGGSFTDIETAAANAKSGATITALDNVTLAAPITIKEGMDVTIEGEGKTITGAEGCDVFYVKGGKLTLSEGLNVYAPTDCAIYIRGGEVITSANLTKGGTKYSVIQGNGQYVGDLTINGGSIKNEVAEKAAIYWPQNGKLVINGGEIIGGTGIRLNSGMLEINGGTIIADGTAQSYVASNGGSVPDTGDAVMIENIGGASGYEEITSVTITGGNFSSENAAAIASYTAGNDGVEAVTGFVTGGKFTSDPSAYIAKGYKVVNSTDEAYKYEIDEISNESAGNTEVETSIVIVTPETTVEVSEDANTTVKDAAAAISNAQVSGTANKTGDIAEEVDVADAVQKLEDEGVDMEEAAVNIFVQPVVNIKIDEESIDEEAADNSTITFDITLTANIIATTAEKLEDVKLDEDKNAVLCATEEMEIEEAVEISIPITEDLKSKLPENIMVKHTKDNGDVYYYAAEVINNAIVFINPNGFSTFEVSKADTNEIKIDFGAEKDKDGKKIDDIDLTIYDIGTEIELTDAYKKNNYFDGWTFGDNKKEYKGKVELTEALWKTLIEEAEEGVVAAAANFTREDNDRGTSTSSGIYVTYKVQFNSTGGTDVADVTVARGANVTEPKAPTKGDFVFGGWYTDRSYSAAYDFSKPVYSSFTLYAKWESADGTILIFNDVTENDWFFDVVYEAYEKGLMNGMSDDAFAPATEVTRGMFVTVLYRIAGEPTASAPAAFEDVAADKYYANAVAWATETGITNGVSETEFMPENSISREQMATILYRYAEVTGEDVSIGGTLSFSDADIINDYAVSAVEWACANGLMNGYPNGTFAPQNTATRAEAAAVLVRMTK